MVSKPWMREPDGPRLDGFLGAFGVKTSRIQTTDELVALARRVYEIHGEGNLSDTANAINDMGKKRRKILATSNIPRVFGGMERKRSEDGQLDMEAIDERSLKRMERRSVPNLIDGRPFDVDVELDIDPAKLLRKVVSAVISAGHASDLYEFPDVLAFFGSRVPADEETIAGPPA